MKKSNEQFTTQHIRQREKDRRKWPIHRKHIGGERSDAEFMVEGAVVVVAMYTMFGQERVMTPLPVTVLPTVTDY